LVLRVEQQERTRRIGALAALVGALALGALALAAGTTALAASAPGVYRVQRMCGHAQSGSAACLSARLLPSSLTQSQRAAAAARAAQAQAAGAQPAVEEESPWPGFLTPQRLHAAYALPSETSASSGQTIAVVDAYNDPSAEEDLAVYDEQFGLPPCTTANGCFRKVNQEGNTSPLPANEGEWATEISIDVQMAHAICQSCHVLLVEAKNEKFASLGAAVNAAADAGASEISNSYGATEESSYTSYETAYYDHPGVVVTASSGDCGYLNKKCAWDPIGANFPASSADVLAVGGTSLTESGGTWTSTVWKYGGSGCSSVFSAPLWQSALASFSATGCGGGRSVADVAAIGDPETGIDVYDSTPDGYGDPTGWGVWGGTSVGSPIVAAEFGLAGGAHAAEYPAATLYEHLGDSGALYDVISGGNGSCSKKTSCKAAVGYDGPTGVGSPLGLTALGASGEAPAITGFTPSSGITGSNVTISGSALNDASTVTIAKREAAFTVLSPTEIEATVPNGAIKGPITVTTPFGFAQSATKFKATLSVARFRPKKGPPGTRVIVKGIGFNASSTVSFGGTPASGVILVTAKELEAVVPSGAGTGPITVTNTTAPVGAVESPSPFTVT
jgi:IPT/TIG domain